MAANSDSLRRTVGQDEVVGKAGITEHRPPQERKERKDPEETREAGKGQHFNLSRYLHEMPLFRSNLSNNSHFLWPS